MKETFKEFYFILKKFFNNSVYVKDVNSNNPIDFSVREIKIEDNYLFLDGKKISIENFSDNVIIIYGSVEKIENCKNVFVVGDSNLINNVEHVICSDVEGDIICSNLKANNITSDNIVSENIECSDIDGNIKAGGDVKCNNVTENIISQGEIIINGDIGGDLNAHNIQMIGNVAGNVICIGDLSQKGDIFGDVYESIKD